MTKSLSGWRLAALALVLFAALCTAFALLSEFQFELFSHIVLIVGICLLLVRFFRDGKQDS